MNTVFSRATTEKIIQHIKKSIKLKCYTRKILKSCKEDTKRHKKQMGNVNSTI